jgi:hypothetical protein
MFEDIFHKEASKEIEHIKTIVTFVRIFVYEKQRGDPLVQVF